MNLPIHDESRLDALGYMNAGVAAAKGDDLAGVTGCFPSAVAGHPDSPDAQNNLGQAVALQRAYGEAVKYYRTALEVEPGLVEVPCNLAVALEETEDVGGALDPYRATVVENRSGDKASAAIARLEDGRGDREVLGVSRLKLL